MGQALLAVLVLVVAGGLGVYVVGTGSPSSGVSLRPDEGAVLQVTDGDTLVIDIGGSEEHVRLIGIDTPESVARDRPNECYGKEASRRMSELLPVGSTVRLERDIEPRDRYDRLLAYVYRSDDGLLVNLDQVANGFAEAKEYPPNTARAIELEAAETSARTSRLGVWSACGGTDTPLP